MSSKDNHDKYKCQYFYKLYLQKHDYHLSSLGNFLKWFL